MIPRSKFRGLLPGGTERRSDLEYNMYYVKERHPRGTLPAHPSHPVTHNRIPVLFSAECE